MTRPNPLHSIPERDKETYIKLRDTMIAAHCDYPTEPDDAEPHVCQGRISITAEKIQLNCRLCGNCKALL